MTRELVQTMGIRPSFRATLLLTFTATLGLFGCASTGVTTIPFDDQAHQVAVDAIVRGQRLTFLVDTAVTPSVIDLSVAKSLGLTGADGPSGQASGTGNQSAAVFPAELRDVQVGRLKVDHLDAVAFDMRLLSRKFGRPLHGVLGESFLKGRTILIDYADRTLTIFRDAAEADRAVAGCADRHLEPMELVADDVAPKLILTIGSSRVPVSLDTGSALGLELYDGALAPGEDARVLSDRKERIVTGARGEATVSEASLTKPVQLGPFRWEGATVVLSGPKGSPETRLGNLGNGFLEGKTLLLDYQRRVLGLFGSCGKSSAKRAAP